MSETDSVDFLVRKPREAATPSRDAGRQDVLFILITCRSSRTVHKKVEASYDRVRSIGGQTCSLGVTKASPAVDGAWIQLYTILPLMAQWVPLINTVQ